MRQYAREKLEEAERAEATCCRHRDFFLALAQQAESKLRGLEQGVWLDRLEAENDNLRAALTWSVEKDKGEGAVRLAGALGEFWHVRGYYAEGQHWLERVLRKSEKVSSLASARALRWAGVLAWRQGDNERARSVRRKPSHSTRIGRKTRHRHNNSGLS